MTPGEILARIDVVCARGGDVLVDAAYPGDPSRGCTATVRLATPWKGGAEVFTGAGPTAAAALAAALARVQMPSPRAQAPAPASVHRPSKRIEGRWFITDSAARDYMRLMRPRRLDIEQATDELIALSEHAHLVRQQDNALELWRVKAPNRRRIRLLVGPPDGVRGGKPALVRCLDEHDGA